LAQNLGFFYPSVGKWLLVYIGLAVQVDSELLSVVGNKAVRLHLNHVCFDAELGQITFYSDQLVSKPVISLGFIPHDPVAFLSALLERLF